MKHEVLSSLLPIFLGNHPNSGSVLHYAWHYQGQSTVIRTLVMHAMAEWYMRGDPHDQTRLSRILDVAQDLKVVHAKTIFMRVVTDAKNEILTNKI